MGQFAKPVLTGAERSLDYMIGQTAPKEGGINDGKTGNSMNQEPSLNIMMRVNLPPILYRFGKPLPVILRKIMDPHWCCNYLALVWI
jgi:hypothetical protein